MVKLLNKKEHLYNILNYRFDTDSHASLVFVNLILPKVQKRSEKFCYPLWGELTFLESTASAIIFIHPLKVATWKRHKYAQPTWSNFISELIQMLLFSWRHVVTSGTISWLTGNPVPMSRHCYNNIMLVTLSEYWRAWKYENNICIFSSISFVIAVLIYLY